MSDLVRIPEDRFSHNKAHFQLYEEHIGIGRYCGENVKQTLTTESNSLYVVFKSDSSLSGKGFEAEYLQVEGNICILFLIVL